MSGRLRRLHLGGLARNRWLAMVVVILLALGLVLEARALLDDDSLPEAAPASREVARDFALAVTSFDHTKIDADVARVLALTTPAFEREFRSAMGDDFTSRIVGNQTVSTGSLVAGPRLQRLSGGAATFLVVVDQQITSQAQPPEEQEPSIEQIVLLVSVDQDAAKVANVQEVWRS